MEGDERRDKKTLLPKLSKDRFFSQSERETNRRPAVDWIEGEGEVKGRLFQTQKPMKELFFFLEEKKKRFMHCTQTKSPAWIGVMERNPHFHQALK